MVPSTTTRSPAARPLDHHDRIIVARSERHVAALELTAGALDEDRRPPFILDDRAHRNGHHRPSRSGIAHTREHFRLAGAVAGCRAPRSLLPVRVSGSSAPATRATRPSNGWSAIRRHRDADPLTGLDPCRGRSRERTQRPRRATDRRRSSPAQPCRCDTRPVQRPAPSPRRPSASAPSRAHRAAPRSTPSNCSRLVTSSSVARACSSAAVASASEVSAVMTSFWAMARLARRSRTRLTSASALATAACRCFTSACAWRSADCSVETFRRVDGQERLAVADVIAKGDENLRTRPDRGSASFASRAGTASTLPGKSNSSTASVAVATGTTRMRSSWGDGHRTGRCCRSEPAAAAAVVARPGSPARAARPTLAQEPTAQTSRRIIESRPLRQPPGPERRCARTPRAPRSTPAWCR